MRLKYQIKKRSSNRVKLEENVVDLKKSQDDSDEDNKEAHLVIPKMIKVRRSS